MSTNRIYAEPDYRLRAALSDRLRDEIRNRSVQMHDLASAARLFPSTADQLLGLEVWNWDVAMRVADALNLRINVEVEPDDG